MENKTGAETVQETVSAIAVSSRIPEFWEDKPRLWFIQAEAILKPQNASDESKYNVVIARLGKDVITQVTDILITPPAIGKYEALKNRLLEVYEESESRQLQKLIGEMELGDQKPSQLLRRMKDLARDKVPDQTLSILWINHLPMNIRSVLAVADAKDLSTLSSIADKVMETSRPINAVARVDEEKPMDFSGLVAEIKTLTARLGNLENTRSRFDNFQRNGRGRGRGGRSQSRGRSSSRIRPGDPNWLCSYHFRYKHKAHKCIEPCNWNKRNGKKEQNKEQEN